MSNAGDVGFLTRGAYCMQLSIHTPTLVVRMSDCIVNLQGRYLFSAAGSNVHMMTVNTHVLSAQAALGGSGSEPFVSMLEGGRDGHLYKDMEDYFYYIQLDNQGMDRMETRTVGMNHPLNPTHADRPYILGKRSL